MNETMNISSVQQAEEPIIDTNLLAKEQLECKELDHLRSMDDLRFVIRPVAEGNLWCEISTGFPRPYVLPKLRRMTFWNLHRLSHPGVKATRCLVTSCFIWPSMNADVNKWTRECLDCQRAKLQTHGHPPVGEIPMPERRFQHVHVDLVGQLPLSQGHTYLFTMIDRFSRWPVVVPVTDIATKTCA